MGWVAMIVATVLFALSAFGVLGIAWGLFAMSLAFLFGGTNAPLSSKIGFRGK